MQKILLTHTRARVTRFCSFINYEYTQQFTSELYEFNYEIGFLLFRKGIRPFDTEDDLNQVFQSHKGNHDFAIIFDKDMQSGQLNYTIRTRNNNFYTDRIFWDNVYEIAAKGSVMNDISNFF